MTGERYSGHSGPGYRPDPGLRVGAQVAAIAVAAGHDVLSYRLAAGQRPCVSFGRGAASAAARFGVVVAELGIARGVGISWGELGLGLPELRSGVRTGMVAAACAAAAIFAGAAWPGTRPFFLDERAAAADRHGALAAELARIAFAAVPAEELTYRSALLGLWLGNGQCSAVAWTSALFGLSHVLPTMSTMSQTALGRHLERRPVRQAAFAVGNVAATGVAGAVFGWLRLRSGSVAAPLLAHAALNGAALGAGRVAHELTARRAQLVGDGVTA